MLDYSTLLVENRLVNYSNKYAYLMIVGAMQSVPSGRWVDWDPILESYGRYTIVRC